MNFKKLALLMTTSIALVGCASSGNDVNDPIEGVNRGIFKFNDVVDTAVIKPVAEGYRAGVPAPARQGVRNALRNLKTPTTLANNILQGDATSAGDTVTRFMANTLLGLGGLVDVAGAEGVKYKEEDFGQTMGVWGAGHGSYLVLPFFGPSSLRDATGLAVDSYADPVRLWLTNTDRELWSAGRVALATVDKREELLDVLEDLKKNSIDYYAATRSAYIQKRDAMVHGARNTIDMGDTP